MEACVDLFRGDSLGCGVTIMWSRPLKNFPFEKIKSGQAPIPWGYSRLLIRSHALRLSGWRPSLAVYHFGGYEPCASDSAALEQ